MESSYKKGQEISEDKSIWGIKLGFWRPARKGWKLPAEKKYLRVKVVLN